MNELQAGFHHLAKGWVAGELPGVQVGAGQLSVVIQHLFEVRHAPEVISGITREASADHVVHAAASHGMQHMQGRRQSLSLSG